MSDGNEDLPPTSQRFFRAFESVYTAIRASLDVSFGHPKTVNGVHTESCMQAAADARRTQTGEILVSLRDTESNLPEVVGPLANLIAVGQVTEITEAEWWAGVDILVTEK